MDALGHINNTVPAVWFEMARNPLFKIFDPDLKLALDKWSLIIARTDYDFIGELYFHFDVEIRSWVNRIGNKSFTIHHEAHQQGRLCVKGDAVVVHYDFMAGKSTPIPEDKKKLLEEHFIQDDAGKGN
jgi:acyl-CoA thioester hydrolase